MKYFAGICALVAIGSSFAPGQRVVVDKGWTGTWTLNLPESTFTKGVIPGLPESLTVLSQTLKITRTTTGHLKGSGDTDIAEFGPFHGDFDVNLDGTETIVRPLGVAPGVTIATRLIDDATIDIIVKLEGGVGVNRFVLSDDGRKITETKTQTATDLARSPATRTSTSVLVFYKVHDSK